MIISIRNKFGFTLIELMIVVSVIGILSSVAIPNFKKYQAKSRTSEAKLQLASIFVAETAFYADYNVYASCLASMGYDPSTESARRYYTVGFSSSNQSINNSAVAVGAIWCTSSHFFVATRAVGTYFPPTSISDVSATTGSESLFTAGADGQISSEVTTDDEWTIGENKVFTNGSTGY